MADQLAGHGDGACHDDSSPEPPVKPPCPECGSDRVQGHGAFALQDGTIRKRYICRACGRTFSNTTKTPVAYLKKHYQWEGMVKATVAGQSLRSTAHQLGLHLSTAFRWRHRLLAHLAGQPKLRLTGCLALCEVFVPYSTKGNHQPHKPCARPREEWEQLLDSFPPQRKAARRRRYDFLLYGASVQRATRRLFGRGGYHSAYQPNVNAAGTSRPFRRFVDGRPSCVLMVGTDMEESLSLVGAGRPALADLQKALAEVVLKGAELWVHGFSPWPEAAKSLELACHSAFERERRADWAKRGLLSPGLLASRLSSHLYGWLAAFHGVATRYLPHYLHWYRFTRRTAGLSIDQACQRLLAESTQPPPSVPAA